MLFALVLGVVAVALVAYDRLGPRLKLESAAYGRGAALVCAIASLVAVATMYQAGHSGAEVTWGGSKQSQDAGEGDEGDEGRLLPAQPTAIAGAMLISSRLTIKGLESVWV